MYQVYLKFNRVTFAAHLGTPNAAMVLMKFVI